jgi:uncharacterized membrane protein (DUF373 family)
MKRELLAARIIYRVELITISAMQLLLILAIATATIVLFVLFARNLIAEASKIESVAELLPTMQQSFAGILIVVLGLELLETLKTYFTEHHVRVEVILVVAIIAVGRHVIQVDFEHTPGTVELGLAALIVALVLGYFLVKKTQHWSKPSANGVPAKRNEDQADVKADLSENASGRLGA